MRPPINLHVDELVLHGVRPGDRHRVADALQAELARLLARGEAPALLRRGASVDALRTPPLRVAPSAGPAALGRGIARTVFHALGEPPR